MILRVFDALHRTFWMLWERPLLGPAETERTERRHPNAPANLANARAVIALALGLAVLAAAASYARASMFSPVIHKHFGYGVDRQSGPVTANLLFDADIPRFNLTMTDRWHVLHTSTRHHPLLSLYIFPPVRVLMVAGLAPAEGIRIFVAASCGVWTALMFCLLVLWGCRTVDAVVFTVLAAISASSVFWFSVPECYAIASATIIAALILTLWPLSVSPIVRYTAATALSLSMTVTNAVVGLIACMRRLPTKDVWVVGASAWFIVCMLWAVQKMLFPAAEFFFPASAVWQYVFSLTPSRVLQVLQVMLSHVVVMPEIGVISGADWYKPGAADRVISVQRSFLGSGGLPGGIATLAWLVLAGLGAWAAWSAPSGLAIICLLAAASQIVLHLTFGPETFLYTLNIVPLLIVLVAGVTFTRFRLAAVSLACAVIVLGGASNWAQFQRAVAITYEMDFYARTFPGARP
jgi:hypothetical protein